MALRYGMLSKLQTKQFLPRKPTISRSLTSSDTSAEGLVAPTLETLRGRQTPGISRVLCAVSAGFICLAHTSLLTAAPAAESRPARAERDCRDNAHSSGALTSCERVTAATKTERIGAAPRAKLPSYVPRVWLPSRGDECIHRGPNRGFCAGPRKVPVPYGAAAALAHRLGLGERLACGRLLGMPPPAAWVHAAQPSGAATKWLWPVESNQIVRGVGNLRIAQKRRQRELSSTPLKHKPAHHEHEGVDVLAAEGAPIRAMQHGLVIYSDNSIGGYGNLVVVLHKDTSIALYAHCRSTYVFAGQRVQRGQVIAEVGHTGYARGSHLHFEYRVNGYARDPLDLFAPH
jgi:murein DD-endopeptidase MepM/ murein hydrolase activator NlpD